MASCETMDAWYDAFGVREEYKLYLPPRQRVTIWQPG